MKKQPKHTDVSAPPSVTKFIKLKTDSEAIQIGFTRQRISPHGGLITFAGFLHWQGLNRLLEQWLPQRTRSPKALARTDLALGFIAGLLQGAKKLAQVAFLRRDPALPTMLGIERIGSQSSLTRFFQGFDGAGVNLRSFRPMWHWCVDRLCSRPGGYTLDLDGTHLLHEGGQQEGVQMTYTAKGFKKSLHPLLAVLAEAKLVAGFWLRPGNTRCDNNVIGFTLDLLAHLPRHIHVRLMRADAAFCHEPWLNLLESQGLHYIVVARLNAPVQRLVKKETLWQPTEVPGTEVAEVMHQEWGWRTARRLILLRHRLADKERPLGKRLVDCPGYAYQGLLTSLPVGIKALAVWRDYHGRAGSENVIKELDASFGLPQLCLKKFWSTEAALCLAVFAYNLCVLFERHLGWVERVGAATLRFRLFTTGAILSRTGGVPTIRLSVPSSEQDWWRRVLQKITSPFPNCNSVSLWPQHHPANSPFY
jgi:hypothetical protein